MAQSPSHRFGQIIGEVLEAAIRGPLEEVCRKHGLYLDSKHPRLARNRLNKVAWKDSKGNTHDLDYVIESGGTEEAIGVPKAFIEIAWRRYTKHSRNKAQENNLSKCMSGEPMPNDAAEKFHNLAEREHQLAEAA